MVSLQLISHFAISR